MKTKKILSKPLLRHLFCTALALTVTLSTVFAGSVFAADEQQEIRTYNLAVLSDIHYVTNLPTEGDPGYDSFIHAQMAELRLMSDIDAVLNEALTQVIANKPDATLVCGDLVSNGELENGKALAKKLTDAKEQMAGSGIYVVNGNHDINNSYAADFSEAEIKEAARTQAEDFRKVFDKLGYGDEAATYYTPTVEDKAINYGALSYAKEILPGVTLIVLDTAIYGNDAKARFNDAQKTPGYVSDGLLNWAKTQAEEAKAKGNLVLTMSHHALLPHYSTNSSVAHSYMENFLIPNWENVANTLGDAGVTAFLTGHSHANDIAVHTTPAGNTVYDIETAALCVYPCGFRTLKITIEGSGKDAIYHFDIDSHFLSKAEGVSDDLQTYSRDRMAFTDKTVEPTIDYLVRNTLYSAYTFNDETYGTGLEGYLKKMLNIKKEDGKLADALVDKIEKTIIGLKKTPFQKEIKIGDTTYKLRIAYDSRKDHLLKLNAKLTYNTKEGKKTETGVISLDLSGLSHAIDEILAKLNEGNDEKLKTSSYYVSPLQKDINALLTQILVTAGYVQLDEKDPNSTMLAIANEAYAAFQRGDESTFVWKGLNMSPEELKQKRAHWTKLLRGSTFPEKISAPVNTIITEITNDKLYPQLSVIFNDINLTDKKSIVSIDSEGSTFALVKLFAENIKTLSTIFDIASLTKINLIPDSAFSALGNAMADLQEMFTKDANIASDGTFRFHTVQFNSENGSGEEWNFATVEDGNLSVNTLPNPKRSGYQFNGWFTQPSGGKKVTEKSDFTNTSRVYAHWAKAVTFKNTKKTFRAAMLAKSAASYSVIKKSGGGKVSVARYYGKSKKYITVSAKGQVTVKKKTPKGTYRLKLKVAASGGYNPAAKVITVIVK